MIMDFMEGTGRFDECFGDVPMYSRYDLEKGLFYAEGYMEEGLKIEPFYRFELSKFAEWIREKLNDKTIS